MDYTEIIGLMAAVFTTASFLPQAIKVIKTKNTNDLSLSMYSLFVCGVCFWLAYGILIDSLPIIAANTVTLLLSGTILFMKMRYK